MTTKTTYILVAAAFVAGGLVLPLGFAEAQNDDNTTANVTDAPTDEPDVGPGKAAWLACKEAASFDECKSKIADFFPMKRKLNGERGPGYGGYRSHAQPFAHDAELQAAFKACVQESTPADCKEQFADEIAAYVEEHGKPMKRGHHARGAPFAKDPELQAAFKACMQESTPADCKEQFADEIAAYVDEHGKPMKRGHHARGAPFAKDPELQAALKACIEENSREDCKEQFADEIAAYHAQYGKAGKPGHHCADKPGADEAGDVEANEPAANETTDNDTAGDEPA